MTLSEPTAEQRSQLKITGGVLVEDVAGGGGARGHPLAATSFSPSTIRT